MTVYFAGAFLNHGKNSWQSFFKKHNFNLIIYIYKKKNRKKLEQTVSNTTQLIHI